VQGRGGLQIHLNRLPHWRLPSSVYFVTWRVENGVVQLRPTERDTVAESLKHFHLQRYRLFGYVVMNDHVHAVAQPLGREELSTMLKNWKSCTSHTINKSRATSGPLWMKDTFNRIVRDEQELIEKLQYMLNNPFKRWPELTEYPWAEWFEWDG
jgi:putative transposase